MRDPARCISALENTAHLALSTQPELAAVLLATTEAERLRHQMPGLSHERRRIAECTERAQVARGDARHAETSAVGATLTLEEALARAEAFLGIPPAAPLGS